ncbi:MULTISPECIES: IS110 family transposase [Nocardia]|uniref:IS110 family transposase n=1 Tax=Nocardia nova TaxID=37330 RepID=A0A2T2YQB7_9NOCA|nr:MULTISPECIES: IS110 family transposase [Nocardia]PSR57705.1 IS110 family transposase [Nocardia nova]
MTNPASRTIFVGVDTHADTHHVAIVNEHGKKLTDREFPTTSAGYEATEQWINDSGRVARVGIEGTGSYGVELARQLRRRGYDVAEVPRPNRRLRRAQGKSDAIDAYAAARRLLDGSEITAPKNRDGAIEAVRALRVARNNAVKAISTALNTLRALIGTSPEELRGQLRKMPRARLIATCAAFEPDLCQLTDPIEATKLALRSLAQRISNSQAHADQLKQQLGKILEQVAPNTMDVFALGPDTVAALVISIGDNPDRLISEAAFARLCGVAPIPASSGKTTRHRLHRGGDRQANQALHTAVIVRMRYHEDTKAYPARRKHDGKTTPEILRCLKSYLAREVFRALRTDYRAMTA